MTTVLADNVRRAPREWVRSNIASGVYPTEARARVAAHTVAGGFGGYRVRKLGDDE